MGPGLKRVGMGVGLGILGGLMLGPMEADDWPQWLGPQRDGVWREEKLVEQFPAAGLPVRWRTPVGGGYAGPAVADGRVVVTDRQLTVGSFNPSDPFQRGRIPGNERVLCLEESGGRVLWSHSYEAAYTMSYAAGPRATPILSGDRVYALGGEGHLVCLDAGTGVEQWHREFNAEFGAKTPTWGFAAHPLLDGGKLICLAGGEGSLVIALDKDTGKELWRSLSAKEPGYCPPVIYEFGGRRQLIIWHPQAVVALDPENGKMLWSHPWEIQAGMSIATPRREGDRLYFTAFYSGSLLLQVQPEGPPTVLWRSRKASEKDTEKLHSTMSTPAIVGGHIYGVCSYGQLRGLRLADGERLWETFAATTGEAVRWGNAFLVRQGETDRFWLFNERGDLILARLIPKGYEEISRMHVLEPTNEDPRRPVVWSHPAFANRHVYVRNDKELVCVDAAGDSGAVRR